MTAAISWNSVNNQPKIVRIDRTMIAQMWPWLEERCGMPGLLPRLMQSKAAAYAIVGTDAAIILSTGTTKDTGARALWIESLAGGVGFRPKANLELMRAVLGDCEAIARQSDCSEMRVERGVRAGWKHRLLEMFGFAAKHAGTALIFRKEVSDGR